MTKYRGICFLPDKKTLCIHREGSNGSDDLFDFGAWRKTNPCEENKFHGMCVEWVRKQKSSYSTLWVNGAYVSYFDSIASFGSNQQLIDQGDVPLLGNGNLCGYHGRGAWSEIIKLYRCWICTQRVYFRDRYSSVCTHLL